MQTLFAQNTGVDSLKQSLSKGIEEMARYKLLTEIASGYYNDGVGENGVARRVYT